MADTDPVLERWIYVGGSDVSDGERLPLFLTLP